MSFIQYYDVLSNDEYSICKDIISNSKWNYGWTSTGRSNTKFWMTELGNNPFFINTFFPKIYKLTNEKFDVVRLYANGHTFGQECDWHRDSPHDDAWTFLYYFNEGDPSEIGETYFRDEDNNITDIAKPIFNSAIFFKSTLNHRGSAPTMSFNDLRVTIAFKLRKKVISSII